MIRGLYQAIAARGLWGRAILLALAANAPLPAAAQASNRAGVFYLQNLPLGKDVTIPKPATTWVPMAQRVKLTATDTPQSVSFRPVSAGSGVLHPIKISIFDPNSERVKYVSVAPGTPFLYTFRQLGSITVIPEKPAGADEGLSLQIESDKPLEIAR
jgi:hypothetical protein